MWAVAQLQPYQTAAAVAVENSLRQKFTVFNPLVENKKLRRNKLVTVESGLFSGYLFIELINGQRWTPIQHQRNNEIADP